MYSLQRNSLCFLHHIIAHGDDVGHGLGMDATPLRALQGALYLMGIFIPAFPRIGTFGGTIPAARKPGCPVRAVRSV